MTDRKEASVEFLDLFFPIHYLVGIQIEDALKCGVLTRQQACILWLIRTRGENGTSMRRKDIEIALSGWYEVTSSAISKSLRALAKPPMDLLSMSEDPNSGREKVVTLTPRGRQYLNSMIQNGIALMDVMVARMNDEEIVNGISFLKRVTEISKEVQDEALTLSTRARQPRAKT
nr:MarR family transcriptional regulator [uncultured Hyphomonas sp.]